MAFSPAGSAGANPEPDHAALAPDCAGFTATITGTSGADILVGTSGDDVIKGLGGDDVIDGRGGNDIILGGAGRDTITGGSGDDLICGGGDSDTLSGNGGADSIHGNGGDDVVAGNGGDDVLFGGSGADTIEGASGLDTISGGGNPDVLSGGGDADLIFGDNGADDIRGNGGNDTIWTGNGADEARGNGGDDLIYGSAGNDKLYGNADNDQLFGGDGNDRLSGAGGDDALTGDEGDDRAFGGDGEDLCDTETADAACEAVVGGDPVEAPFGLFVTSDGGSEVELTWADPDGGAAIVGVNISRDGALVGTVGPGVERFVDTGASPGVPHSYEIASVAANGTTASDQPMVVNATASGVCESVLLDGTNTAVLLRDSSLQSLVWVSEELPTGFELLDAMTIDTGSAVMVDTERDWSDASPSYRVTHYDLNTGVWRAFGCSVGTVVGSRANLRSAGLPVLANGQIGSDFVPTAPVRLGSTVQASEMTTSAANAVDLCAAEGASGLIVEIPAAANYTIYGNLYVPSGVTVTADIVTHNGNLQPGGMDGLARVWALNPDGSTQSNIPDYSRSFSGGFFWTEREEYVIDDGSLFYNDGPAGVFRFQLTHSNNFGMDSSDDAHYRFNDFTFITDDGLEIDPCATAEVLDCQANGGNLVILEPTVFEGELRDPGCYTYESCVSDMGPALEWLAEWSCENQEELIAAQAVIFAGDTQ